MRTKPQLLKMNYSLSRFSSICSGLNSIGQRLIVEWIEPLACLALGCCSNPAGQLSLPLNWSKSVPKRKMEIKLSCPTRELNFSFYVQAQNWDFHPGQSNLQDLGPFSLYFIYFDINLRFVLCVVLCRKRIRDRNLI